MTAERRCYFEECVATWRHWHGFLPGGYWDPEVWDDDAKSEGVFTFFEGDEPDEGVRDYNGAPLRASPAESSDPRPQLPLGGGPVEDSAGVREHTTRTRTAGA